MFTLSDQPQIISEVWSDAFKLFKTVFKSCAAFAMLFPLLTFSANHFFMYMSPHVSLGLLLFFAFIVTVFSMIFLATLLHWIYALIKAKEAALSASFSVVRSKFLTLLIASFLYYLIVSLGILLIIPGIIFVVFLLFYMASILFDDAGIFSSLGHSWRLVRGHWWQTFSLVFFASALALFSMFLTLLFVPLGKVFVFLFYIFLTGSLSIFSISLMLVQFNNLKISLLMREAEAVAAAEAEQNNT